MLFIWIQTLTWMPEGLGTREHLFIKHFSYLVLFHFCQIFYFDQFYLQTIRLLSNIVPSGGRRSDRFTGSVSRNNLCLTDGSRRPLDSDTDRAAGCVASVSKLPRRILYRCNYRGPVLNLNYADCLRSRQPPQTESHLDSAQIRTVISCLQPVISEHEETRDIAGLTRRTGE